MAASKQCSICTKALGAMYCTGCDEYFCWKDFKTHREGMFTQMDRVIDERNHLQDAINNEVQRNAQQSPLIEQIDQWETNTIEKIKQVAAQAREQVSQLLDSKRMKISTEFKTFCQELADLKESENYVEHDLTRLNQMISQFKQDLRHSTQPTTIKLHTEQSDGINWARFIYAEEDQTSTANQQRQQQATIQPQVTVPPPQVTALLPQVPAPPPQVRAPAPQVLIPPPQIQLNCLSYPYIKSSLYSERIQNVCYRLKQINECNRGGRACPKCNDHSFSMSFFITTIAPLSTSITT